MKESGRNERLRKRRLLKENFWHERILAFLPKMYIKTTRLRRIRATMMLTRSVLKEKIPAKRSVNTGPPA